MIDPQRRAIFAKMYKEGGPIKVYNHKSHEWIAGKGLCQVGCEWAKVKWEKYWTPESIIAKIGRSYGAKEAV